MSSPRTAAKIILLRLSVVYSVLPVLPPLFFSPFPIYGKNLGRAHWAEEKGLSARAPSRLPGFGGEEEKEACATTPEREKAVLIFPPLEEEEEEEEALWHQKRRTFLFAQWHSRALLFHRFGLLWLWRCLSAVLAVVERRRKRAILQKKSVLRRRQLRRDLYLVGVAKKKRLRRFAKIFAQTLRDPERNRKKAGILLRNCLKGEETVFLLKMSWVFCKKYPA